VFVPLPDYASGKTLRDDAINVLLRHDVDLGDSQGLEALCKAELSLGLQSSVHFQIDGTAYDPAKFRLIAGSLAADGFDVGLHTQAWMHRDFEKVFRRELEQFEEVFGFAPRTFTQHGAWPRTADDLTRRQEFTQATSALIGGSQIVGYNNDFDWVSEDSNIDGRHVPLTGRFFAIPGLVYRGASALILTHDGHWRAD
jgi:hypothetical protein